MKSWLQRIFINVLVRHLFNMVTEDDLLRMHGQQYSFLGRALDRETVIRLKADAKGFRDSSVWKVLSTEAKYQANVRMFEKSVSNADILAGKMMLYTVDIIEKKLDQLSS